MKIMAEVIPVRLMEELDFVFKNKIIEKCFDHNMWIAGGFARKIGHIVLDIKNCNVSNKSFITNHLKRGDIDFFTSNIENVYNLANSNSKTVYSTPFALNMNEVLKFSTMQHVVPHAHLMKIQLVTKFCFDSVKECFASFDIVNCRYAIIKKNNHYVLRYTSNALSSDAVNQLEISHSRSPYTIHRITKYMQRNKNLLLSKSASTLKLFKELLLNLLVHNWDDLYSVKNNRSILNRHLVYLSNIVEIPSEDIAMFLGTITKTIAELKTVQLDGYGVYITKQFKEVDWAAHELNSRV